MRQGVFDWFEVVLHYVGYIVVAEVEDLDVRLNRPANYNTTKQNQSWKQGTINFTEKLIYLLCISRILNIFSNILNVFTTSIWRHGSETLKTWKTKFPKNSRET